MLSLLLDENISPVIAAQIRDKRPDIRIQSLHDWHEGEYLGVTDELVLMTAYDEGLTLVTYDTAIRSELSLIFASGAAIGGVILVDGQTIPGNNFGGLIRALIYLWGHEVTRDWHNRVIYLQAPP